jgi:hypothetical protein
MEGIKKFVNILVMLYLVAAVLIFLRILDLGQDNNPSFYPTLFQVSGILLLLELIVENLYLATLKRGHGQTQQKINELKASLYDHKQEIQELRNRHAEEVAAAAKPAPAATSYTTATAPITAAPTGTQPVPPVVKPMEPAQNPNVIITPSPTPGIQDPERRLPENTDT